MPNVQFRWQGSLHQRPVQPFQTLGAALQAFLESKRQPGARAESLELRHSRLGVVSLDQPIRLMNLEHNCVLDVVPRPNRAALDRIQTRLAVDLHLPGAASAGGVPGPKLRLVGSVPASSTLFQALESVERQTGTAVTGLRTQDLKPPASVDWSDPAAPWQPPQVQVLGRTFEELPELLSTSLAQLGVRGGNLVLSLSFPPPAPGALSRGESQRLVETLQRQLQEQRARQQAEADLAAAEVSESPEEQKDSQSVPPSDRESLSPPPPPPEEEEPPAAAEPEELLGAPLVEDVRRTLLREPDSNALTLQDLQDRVLASCAETLELLGRITRNLLLQRANPKFRRLRGIHTPGHSLHDRVGRFLAARAYLHAIGFRRQPPGDDGVVEWVLVDDLMQPSLLQRCTQSVLPEAFLGLETRVQEAFRAAAAGSQVLEPQSQSQSIKSVAPDAPSGQLPGRFDLQDSLIPETAEPGQDESVFDWQNRAEEEEADEGRDVRMGGVPEEPDRPSQGFSNPKKHGYDLSQVRPLLQQLEQEIGDTEGYERALKLLIIVVGNLTKTKDQDVPVEKHRSYRALNRGNIKLGSQLLGFTAACSFLEWLGFVPETSAQGQEVFTLPEVREHPVQAQRALAVLQAEHKQLEASRERRLLLERLGYVPGASATGPVSAALEGGAEARIRVGSLELPREAAIWAAEFQQTRSGAANLVSGGLPAGVVDIPADPLLSFEERPTHVLRQPAPGAVAARDSAADQNESEEDDDEDEALRRQDLALILRNRQAQERRNRILFPEDVIMSSEKQQELLQRMRPVYDELVLRVVVDRRPGQLSVQGRFRCSETLAHVFAWLQRLMHPQFRPVTASDAGSACRQHLYGLKLWPTTRINLRELDPMTRLGELGLAPAAALHISWEFSSDPQAAAAEVANTGFWLQEVVERQQDPTPEVTAAPKPANQKDLQDLARQQEMEVRWARRKQQKFGGAGGGDSGSSSSSAATPDPQSSAVAKGFASRLLRR